MNTHCNWTFDSTGCGDDPAVMRTLVGGDTIPIAVAMNDATPEDIRLMASAPSLLAALEDIVRLTEISDVWLPASWKDDAVAAIAKAKGAR